MTGGNALKMALKIRSGSICRNAMRLSLTIEPYIPKQPPELWGQLTPVYAAVIENDKD